MWKEELRKQTSTRKKECRANIGVKNTIPSLDTATFKSIITNYPQVHTHSQWAFIL